MKKLMFSLCFLLLSMACYAQCDSGLTDETYICLNDHDTIWLNHPLVESDYGEEYQFRWSLNSSDTGFNASELLSDTSSLSPFFKGWPENDSLLFYLEVSNNSGIVCSDSTLVYFSIFWMSTWEAISINRGDTITLHNPLDGGIGELMYSWSPLYGMLESESLRNPLVSPDSTTLYFCHIEDQIGCQRQGTFKVNVDQSNFVPNYEFIPFKIFPNIVRGDQIIYIKEEYIGMDIYAYSIDGEVVLSQKLSDNFLRTDSLARGLYHLILLQKGKPIYISKFVKE